MITSSPLRYPGGKSSLTHLLRSIRSLNGLGHLAMAEPFAGGAGASLGMLYGEETPELFINDADPAIYDFWWCLLNRSAEFGVLLEKTKTTIAEWRRQRDVYRKPGRVGQLRRGFATFYLNRCNRSGIIVNGGPIGGIRQEGPWKLNARFNKADLLARCQRVGEYKGRIHLSKLDGRDLISSADPRRTFFFVDPPYYEKGKTLYLNALDDDYHAQLGATLRDLPEKAAWVLTYDDHPRIREIYSGWARVRSFSIGYAANTRRAGREVLVTPPWMKLPSSFGSAAARWV